MPLYLSESLIGAGTLRDPFRPRGADQPGWSVLYLGATNKSLLWLPSVSLDAGLTLLGLDPADTLGPALRSTVETKLNVTLTLQKASDVVAEIMLTSGKGWNPVQATKDGKIEIWLANTLWHQQVLVKGAATDSSAFTGAENPLSESGKWATAEGAWSAVKKNADRARASAGNVNTGARCTTTFGSDQYSEANYYGGSSQFPALLTRVATNVSYYAECGLGADFKLYKSNSSLSFTQIGSGAGTPVSGHLARFEVSGSTLTLKDNGSTVRTETDTTIASGSYAGIALYQNGSTESDCEMDNWGGGDLGGGAATKIKDMLGLDWIPKKR